MSAGSSDAQAQVNRDPELLAPAFRAAVEAALAECVERNLDAFVYEGYRSQALQSLYYARGRTVIPPSAPVTNASSNLYSWHGFGLAVDVISQSKGWNQPDQWFSDVADCFKRHGCRWGGDWQMRDLPHMQWGPCKPSPSDIARELLQTQGLQAVWKAVGAAEAPAARAAAAGIAAGIVSSGDPDIDCLALAGSARNAAIILKARFPNLRFTSGRRDKQNQASAMASNVVQNRRWIEQTYRASPVRDACQGWIDAHREATTVAAITAGLCDVLSRCSDDTLNGFSRHLTGYAFDVQPVVTADGEVIKQFIRSLPKLDKFLEIEGGLVRWHTQFNA